MDSVVDGTLSRLYSPDRCHEFHPPAKSKNKQWCKFVE